MPTPIENLTQNVNASTQRTVLQAVANDATARQQAADKSSAINAIIDNADQQAVQNFFGGIAGDETAEDLLTGNNALIDKVSEDVDAIETLNASESAIRKMLCRREGRDPANFADLDAVADDQGLMQAIAARHESSKILARSQKASAAAAISPTAMQELINSPTAMVNVRQSPTADSLFYLSSLYVSTLESFASINTNVTGGIDDIAGSQTAMQEVINSQTARQEVFNSQAAMQEVAASQTAIQEVINSQTAMQEVAASQPAMQEVAASQTAIQEVVTSQAAMQAVAASETALDELSASQTMGAAVASSTTAIAAIEGASSTGNDSIPGIDSASIYIAELSGAGGGGGDNSGVSEGDGSEGGSTTFNQTTAEGGDGGDQFGGNKAPNGGFDVNSPDILINGVAGGGAAGGNDASSEEGGDGGFVKALIMNPGRTSLSLSIGQGGAPGADAQRGEDGGATILLPQAY